MLVIRASCEGSVCIVIFSDDWKSFSSPLAPISHQQEIWAAFLLIFLLQIFIIIVSSAKVSILIKVNVGKQSSAKPCRHQGSSPRQEEVGKGLEDLEGREPGGRERCQ